MKLAVVFEVNPGVSEEQAYEAAEAMVTAAPLEMACMIYQGIEVER